MITAKELTGLRREEMLDEIFQHVNSETGRIRDPRQFIEWLHSHSYFKSPASTKYHGSYKGGLFSHSLAVAKKLVELTEQGICDEWRDPNSPWIVGLFHDLCKCEEYQYQDTDGACCWVHVDDSTLLKGHGDKSVMMLSRFMTLTEEEILCIRYHMGAFNSEDIGLYSKAVNKYPNVLWTHTADMYASQVLGV